MGKIINLFGTYYPHQVKESYPEQIDDTHSIRELDLKWTASITVAIKERQNDNQPRSSSQKKSHIIRLIEI